MQQCPNLPGAAVELRNKERVFIFGASGHSKVIIDIVEKEGRYDIACLVDDNGSIKGADFFGYRVIGGRAELLEFSLNNRLAGGIVAIGNNAARTMVAEWLIQSGLNLVSAIHPSANIGQSVQVGRGTVVMANATINPDTRVGDNVIVNTGAVVDHDCLVGDSVHLGPGSCMCGGVRVGDGAFIGAGSTVIPGILIGENAMIGAGSTIIKNVQKNDRVAGCPAKSLGR